MATSPKSPIKYAGIQVTAPVLGRVPLPPGRVYVVRGRTSSTVFHTNPHCRKLREVARPVKRAWAEAGGARLCVECARPQQRWLNDYAEPAQVTA